jgi:hypothetical protein
MQVNETGLGAVREATPGSTARNWREFGVPVGLFDPTDDAMRWSARRRAVSRSMSPS